MNRARMQGPGGAHALTSCVARHDLAMHDTQAATLPDPQAGCLCAWRGDISCPGHKQQRWLDGKGRPTHGCKYNIERPGHLIRPSPTPLEPHCRTRRRVTCAHGAVTLAAPVTSSNGRWKGSGAPTMDATIIYKGLNTTFDHRQPHLSHISGPASGLLLRMAR